MAVACGMTGGHDDWWMSKQKSQPAASTADGRRPGLPKCLNPSFPHIMSRLHPKLLVSRAVSGMRAARGRRHEAAGLSQANFGRGTRGWREKGEGGRIPSDPVTSTNPVRDVCTQGPGDDQRSFRFLEPWTEPSLVPAIQNHSVDPPAASCNLHAVGNRISKARGSVCGVCAAKLLRKQRHLQRTRNEDLTFRYDIRTA